VGGEAPQLGPDLIDPF